jgi:hypothetical protein
MFFNLLKLAKLLTATVFIYLTYYLIARYLINKRMS